MKIKDSSKLNLNSKKSRQGFMLVDGLIAVLIVAIGLVALAFMYTHGIKARVAGERRQAAVQIAGQGMEKLKKADGKTMDVLQDLVDDINDDDPIVVDVLGNYTVRSEIVQETEPTGANTTQKLETVRVTVEWNDPQASTMVLDGYVLVSK
ncbi:MAG: hypothetical protein AB9858_06685 [Acidaminococcaceae bacterium]